MKVMASGICGSDVMEWYRVPKAPRVLGHEATGVITQVGAKVKNTKVGDRVFVSHHVPCFNCRHCQRGNHTACHMLHTTNYYPGGFSQYVLVPKINVEYGIYKLPDAMSFRRGNIHRTPRMRLTRTTPCQHQKHRHRPHYRQRHLRHPPRPTRQIQRRRKHHRLRHQPLPLRTCQKIRRPPHHQRQRSSRPRKTQRINRSLSRPSHRLHRRLTSSQHSNG